MAIIEICNLHHRFVDGTPGLQGIDMQIQEGELVVIAGPNGCGKTTLLRHLNGLLKPSSGDVLLAGKSVAKDPKQARRFVGMVFQDADHQIVGESVADDVAFGPENLGLPRAEIHQRVSSALKTVNLEPLALQPPHLLSGGEKRRLAIAGVLAMHPKVLVFDEPFANLDYPGLLQVQTQIKHLHAQGRTLITATHELEKILPLATRLIFLKDGQIVKDGRPDQILPYAEAFGVRRPCAACLAKSGDLWRN